ncbi:MAG: M48 family metalloprotease [Bacteroidales bacterium]|nr:M48 family metalloprotease [Bacteroidales bacterium]
MMSKLSVFFVGMAMLAIFACSKDNDLNFFTVSQDIAFGEQLDSAVLASPDEYPVLSRTAYPAVYTYLETMMNNILASEEIMYRDEFNWKITVINSDVVNAFAAPGGYLYIYTGLLKYLDNGAQVAGVMGHEIAHTDRRHSTEAMTKEYGFSVLLSIIMGNEATQLEQILSSLALNGTILAFSRKNENEADRYAVFYTADSELYNPLGVGGFFQKMLAEQNTAGTGIPEFLSTHPSDENRIENISATWNELKSNEPALNSVAWNDLVTQHVQIKSTLP